MLQTTKESIDGDDDPIDDGQTDVPVDDFISDSESVSSDGEACALDTSETQESKCKEGVRQADREGSGREGVPVTAGELSCSCSLQPSIPMADKCRP